MSASRRIGPSQGSSGARRPRVAGQRKRGPQDAPAESEVQESTEGGTAEDVSGEPEVSGEQEQASTEQVTTEQPAKSSAATEGSAESASGDSGAASSAAESASEGSASEGSAAPADSNAAESSAAASGAAASSTAESKSAEPKSSEHEDAKATDSTESEKAAPEAETEAAEGEAAEQSADEAHESESESAQQPAKSNAKPIAIMLVLALICAGLAVWFRYEDRQLTAEGPAANEALSNAAETSQLNGQVSDAVEKLFSYNFADTGKTERAAKDFLTGPAVGQYEQLFTTVKQQAPQQKLVLTTTVKSSGVTRLEGDRAQVLLFVDQNAVRTDSGQNNIGPAQVSVSVEKDGDQWKINGITLR